MNTFDTLFSYLGFDYKFVNEIPLSTLSNALQNNVLVGVSGALQGNIMFSYNKKTKDEIAYKMTGEKVTSNDDIYAENAIVDFFTEFCRRLTKIIPTKKGEIFISYPISVSGDNIRAMISQVPSKNLFFKVNGERIAIAYYLEEN